MEIEEGANWEKLQGYLCEISGKRYCCTRNKKVVSLQLYKKCLPSLSWKIKFLYCASKIMILYYLIFLFFNFFWLVGIFFLCVFLLEIVAMCMGRNHSALQARITEFRVISHSVRLVESLHVSHTRSELIVSWSL